MSNYNENMDLWNKVSKTNPYHTKKSKIGQMPITAICPQSQRMVATSVFGPYGKGWGIMPCTEKFDMIEIGETILCTYRAEFFYILQGVKSSFPVCSNVKVSYRTQGGKSKNGYLLVDDEYAKKAQTDALTKGLSFLGFNADVFMGKFDDSKYVQQRLHEVAEETISEDYKELVDKNKVSIEAIKKGIDNAITIAGKIPIPDDVSPEFKEEAIYHLSAAAEAWGELDEETKIGIWKAPRNGGCFTTVQRDVMKTKEFRESFTTTD